MTTPLPTSGLVRAADLDSSCLAYDANGRQIRARFAEINLSTGHALVWDELVGLVRRRYPAPIRLFRLNKIHDRKEHEQC